MSQEVCKSNPSGQSVRAGKRQWQQSNYRCLPLLLWLILLLVGSANAQSEAGRAVLSPAAELWLGSSSEQEMTICWLLLSESARSGQPINLTEKARRRRAKAAPQTLLVDRRDYPVSPVILDGIRQTGARIRNVSRWLNAVSVEVTADQLQQLARLEPIAEIDLVATMEVTRPEVVPYPKDRAAPTRSEELAYGFSLLQNQFVRATKLHQAGYTGAGILIALLDTGFKIDLPAFDSTSIVATWDFINNDETVDEPDCPNDRPSWQQTHHGTLVLGAIGAYWVDTLIGIAPRADFALAKTEISCGFAELYVEEDHWIAGAEWADSIGADIISSSLGYTTFDDNPGYTFEDLDGNTARTTIAADIAASKNILVITAVGNERLKPWNALVTPSDGDSVLAVGAVSSDSSLASFSSPGPSADGRIKPDITSLGVGVTTVDADGSLTSASGTSLSTPLVAGGAALALGVDSTLTAAVLLERIRANGSQADSPDNDFGYGLFDAARSSTLIRIDKVEDIWLQVGQSLQVEITTSGFSASIPILSATDLPAWAFFADHSDGTGLLTLNGTVENAIASQIWLTLQAGTYQDTIAINVYTAGSMERQVTAGPNPFFDSVTIFISPNAGKLELLSIYNVAGEIVWEIVNNSPVSADTPIRWDGTNMRHEVVASGVYFVRVRTSTKVYRLKLFKND